ncbi:MAG: NUDIX hydrolase, partial [Patescibacteria group bacterium]
MKIKSTLKNLRGQMCPVIYHDIESLAELNDKKVDSVSAFCFCGDKLVVVFSEKKGYWTPPGGAVEKSESVETAVIREVKEETNMRVIKQKLIGYQDVFEPEKTRIRVRVACLVEPDGDFTADPDGDITEIKLIELDDYKKYFDWGKIGDRIMDQALRFKDSN